jgi:hypothetical protein
MQPIFLPTVKLSASSMLQLPAMFNSWCTVVADEQRSTACNPNVSSQQATQQALPMEPTAFVVLQPTAPGEQQQRLLQHCQ